MSTTAPVIWITLPVAVFVAVAMLVSSSWVGASTGLRAGRNLDHLAGDVRLANLVVAQREVLDEVLGVLRRVLHRDHAARFLARLGLEDCLVDAGGHVARQELLEDGARVGLEDELAARDALGVRGRLDRQQMAERRALDER